MSGYVWSPDPKTEFLTSMLVLFIGYVVLPYIVWIVLNRRKKNAKVQEEDHPLDGI